MNRPAAAIADDFDQFSAVERDAMRAAIVAEASRKVSAATVDTLRRHIATDDGLREVLYQIQHQLDGHN